MSRTVHPRRWGLCAAAALGLSVLAPMAPAAADTENVYVRLYSGEGLAAVDDFNDVSTDGGATWDDAVVVAAEPGWATIPNTEWISSDGAKGTAREDATTLFRRQHRLPPGVVGSTGQLCIHADDAVTVTYNGTTVVDQPAEDAGNASGEPSCGSVANLAVSGINTLVFTVPNGTGATGIDFEMIMTYTKDLDAAPMMLLSDVTAAAASPAGAAVQFTVNAVDVSGITLVGVPCDPPSGALFPVGATTVTCTATSPTNGAVSTGSFQVTVQAAADAVPPAVDVTASPAAASSGWHTSAPTVSMVATDAGSGVASITYASTGALSTPPTTVAGTAAELPIGVEGVTEVTVTATDAAGNVSAPQVLTVRYDGTAPELTGVRDKRIKVITATRVRAFYDYIGGTDALGGPVEVVCDPPSGSFFALGVSTVTCTATDEAGNTTSDDFTVTIWREDPLDQLADSVAGIAMPRWVRTSLTADLSAAVQHFDEGRTWLGCRELRQMDQMVLARRGKGITWSSATRLRSQIADARSANGCS